jgi:hypothetical protein
MGALPWTQCLCCLCLRALHLRLANGMVAALLHAHGGTPCAAPFGGCSEQQGHTRIISAGRISEHATLAALQHRQSSIWVLPASTWHGCQVLECGGGMTPARVAGSTHQRTSITDAPHCAEISPPALGLASTARGRNGCAPCLHPRACSQRRSHIPPPCRRMHTRARTHTTLTSRKRQDAMVPTQREHRLCCYTMLVYACNLACSMCAGIVCQLCVCTQRPRHLRPLLGRLVLSELDISGRVNLTAVTQYCKGVTLHDCSHAVLQGGHIT